MDAEVRCEDCDFRFRMDVGRIREQDALSCPQCRSHQLAVTWRQSPPPEPEAPPPPVEPYAPLDKITLDGEPEDRPAPLPPVDWDAPPPAFVTHEVIFEEVPDPPAAQVHEVIFDDPPADADAPIHEVLFDDPANDSPPPSERGDSAEDDRPPIFETALSLAGPNLLTVLSLLVTLCICLALTVIHPLAGVIGLIPAAVGPYLLRRRVYIPRDAALRRSARRETKAPRLTERARTTWCVVAVAACLLLTVLVVLLALQ